MVALPLFKLASLFIRHVSKYGANRIKLQAHEHPNFRRFAARHGQSIHQLNMRLSVALLRNVSAEIRAKELAEAPTVKTKEEIEKEEARRARSSSSSKGGKEDSLAKKKRPLSFVGVWKRKFRPLPEQKAVELFADVVGDAFILLVAAVIIVYEAYRSSAKPDANAERIRELAARFDDLEKREAELEEAEKNHRSRVLALEEALRGFKDPKTKQPLLSPAPTPSPSQVSA